MKVINEDTSAAENPPIPKVKMAWRNNWKVAGSIARVITPDKYRIGGGSSGIIVSVVRVRK